MFCPETNYPNPNTSFRFRKAAWSTLSAFAQKSSWAAWHLLLLHDGYRDGQLVELTFPSYVRPCLQQSAPNGTRCPAESSVASYEHRLGLLQSLMP